MPRWIHNPTCGCADCGNYGQKPYYGPHNATCGCRECGNYVNGVHRDLLPRSAPERSKFASVGVDEAELDNALERWRKEVLRWALQVWKLEPSAATLLGDLNRLLRSMPGNRR
jgi:hypothetical protein